MKIFRLLLIALMLVGCNSEIKPDILTTDDPIYDDLKQVEDIIGRTEEIGEFLLITTTYWKLKFNDEATIKDVIAVLNEVDIYINDEETYNEFKDNPRLTITEE